MSFRVCRGKNIYHAGMAAAGIQLGRAVPGDVCNKAMEAGKGNYLANLILYPGKSVGPILLCHWGWLWI